MIENPPDRFSRLFISLRSLHFYPKLFHEPVSSDPPWTHAFLSQAMLSFKRGSSFIYHDLTHIRLKVFLHKKAILHDDAFPLEIHTAIRTASVHIALFSKHYAKSVWSLHELSMMVESRAPIVPVFCEIRPSDQAFRKHPSVQNAETVEKWRASLRRVYYHYGFRFGGDHGVLSLEEISASVIKHINTKRRV